MDEITKALLKTLRELAQLVDDDIPVGSRSRRLNNTLAYAFELAEAAEERPIRDSLNTEPLDPCTEEELYLCQS